jgi:hypothetical protein
LQPEPTLVVDPLDGDLALASHWGVMSVSFLLIGGVVVALLLGIVVFLVFRGRD